MYAGRVAVQRYEDERQDFPARVMEACRVIDPQLIVLGSSEVRKPPILLVDPIRGSILFRSIPAP